MLTDEDRGLVEESRVTNESYFISMLNKNNKLHENINLYDIFGDSLTYDHFTRFFINKFPTTGLVFDDWSRGDRDGHPYVFKDYNEYDYKLLKRLKTYANVLFVRKVEDTTDKRLIDVIRKCSTPLITYKKRSPRRRS
jgi:hypothetical protein